LRSGPRPAEAATPAPWPHRSFQPQATAVPSDPSRTARLPPAAACSLRLAGDQRRQIAPTATASPAGHGRALAPEPTSAALFGSDLRIGEVRHRRQEVTPSIGTVAARLGPGVAAEGDVVEHTRRRLPCRPGPRADPGARTHHRRCGRRPRPCL